jgi:hypothetical protein
LPRWVLGRLVVALLDIWIASPGNACRVDDQPWLVTIYDAHQNLYVRGGQSFSDVHAPLGRCIVSLPPGTFVVQARPLHGGASTDRAIVDMQCDAMCVRLFVGGQPQRPPSDDCSIEIDSAVGIRMNADLAGAVRVTGTAQGCDHLDVTVTADRAKGGGTATVDPNGSWTVYVNVSPDGIPCGASVKVLATCHDNRKCRAHLEVKQLTCQGDGKPYTPR